MTEQKQYNYCLDYIKGIACIFVVFMHCEFPGIMGTAVQAISRFSVPFFFMISGYFCFHPILSTNLYKNTNLYQPRDSKNLVLRKLKHISKITLYASLFYFIFVLFQHLIYHNFHPSINLRSILDWLVFNKPISGIAGQYWFLFALLYAYAFYGILETLRLRKFAYWLAAAMFIIYIVMAQGMHLAGQGIPNMVYRNWLVEAFPYFMLGHWLHENQEKINISNHVLITIIVITTLLCWVERWIMGRDFGVNIVTIPQVFALFVYGMKNPQNHKGLIQRLGRDCSMLVYILHPAVWHSLEEIYYKQRWSDNLLALYIMPILVLGISIVLSLLFNKMMGIIHNKSAIA